MSIMKVAAFVAEAGQLIEGLGVASVCGHRLLEVVRRGSIVLQLKRAQTRVRVRFGRRSVERILDGGHIMLDSILLPPDGAQEPAVVVVGLGIVRGQTQRALKRRV